MDKVISLIGGIDIKYVFVAIAIVALLGVIALIKKAIKVGVLILVIALALTYGGAWVGNMEKKYNVHMEGTTISATVNQHNYNIDLNKVKQINVSNADGSNVLMKITMKNGSKTQIKASKAVYWVFKGKIEKAGIKIVEDSN